MDGLAPLGGVVAVGGKIDVISALNDDVPLNVSVTVSETLNDPALV